MKMSEFIALCTIEMEKHGDLDLVQSLTYATVVGAFDRNDIRIPQVKDVKIKGRDYYEKICLIEPDIPSGEKVFYL